MNLTPNQVVAYNLIRARRLRGWTQEQAAERLEPYLGEHWSKATFSVAERSLVNTHRIRRFNADDLAAFVAAFELPMPFFFTPPRHTDLIAPPDAREGVAFGRFVEMTNAPARAYVDAALSERYRALEDAGIRVSDVPAGVEKVRGHVVPDHDDARELHKDVMDAVARAYTDGKSQPRRNQQ